MSNPTPFADEEIEPRAPLRLACDCTAPDEAGT